MNLQKTDKHYIGLLVLLYLCNIEMASPLHIALNLLVNRALVGALFGTCLEKSNMADELQMTMTKGYSLRSVEFGLVSTCSPTLSHSTKAIQYPNATRLTSTLLPSTTCH